jgi:hypothetical protein
MLSLLIRFDIWVMVTFLGGLPGETISAAAYNSERTGKIGGIIGRPIIDLIFLPFQKQHCQKSWRQELYKGTQ